MGTSSTFLSMFRGDCKLNSGPQNKHTGTHLKLCRGVTNCFVIVIDVTTLDPLDEEQPVTVLRLFVFV